MIGDSGPSSARPSDAESDWLIALPLRVPPVTLVRGTLLVASREQLRAIGAFDRYAEALAPEPRSALASLISASWAPIELAHAHFTAVETLGIDLATIEANTGATAKKLNGMLISAVGKAARASGATPVAAVRLLHTLWVRVFTGGAIGMKQAGPKEIMVIVSGHPLLAYRYHRTGLRVYLTHAVGMLSERAYVREQAYKPAAHELTLRVQWV